MLIAIIKLGIDSIKKNDICNLLSVSSMHVSIQYSTQPPLLLLPNFSSNWKAKQKVRNISYRIDVISLLNPYQSD